MTPYYENAYGKLYCGDCMEIIPALLSDDMKFDVVVTDPPYGIAYETGMRKSKWNGQIKGDRDTSVRDTAIKLLDGLPMLVFGSWRAPRPAGTRMILTWDKGPALGMGALDLPWKPSSEEIYVIGRGFTGKRDESNVIYCPPVQSMAKNGRVHPNEKPVALMVRLLSKCPAGTALDMFAGSATTAVAAQKMGRSWVAIEVEEQNCEIAARRLDGTIKQIEGQASLFEREARP